MRMRLVLLQHCGAFVAWFYYETTSKLDYLYLVASRGAIEQERALFTYIVY